MMSINWQKINIQVMKAVSFAYHLIINFFQNQKLYGAKNP